MKWLSDFIHLPMIWDLIIPVGILLLLSVIVAWESVIPPNTKIFGIHVHPFGPKHKHA